ncbi:MAG TPA: hypothetical protein VE779_05730 [Candidatus Angelobacter sp.]|jgi:type II secretory pathway component PulF|nr:hypothetical protein [Candidatus Angelobacter sp.]
MLQSFRNAAVLAVLAVVLVTLLPAGSGPFTSTHGPVTAVRTVVDHVFDFISVAFVLLTFIAYRAALAFRATPVAAAMPFEPIPVLTLRC